MPISRTEAMELSYCSLKQIYNGKVLIEVGFFVYIRKTIRGNQIVITLL